MFCQSALKIFSGQLNILSRKFYTKPVPVRTSRKKVKTRVNATQLKIPLLKLPPNISIQVQEILSQISHLKSAELKIVITKIYMKIENR